MREILTSAKLPVPRFRYSQCVKTGPQHQFAGMIGLDPANGKLAAGGAERETRQILTNLLAALPDFGLRLEHAVLARIYAVGFEDFPAINKAWEEVFDGAVAPPARTAVGVSALPLGARVCIEFAFHKAD